MAKRRSNIYHRKDGRWEGRMHINGTKKYKSVYGKTYSEAKNKLENLKMSNNLSKKKSNELFLDITKKWLCSTATKIKESSIATYKNKINKHIIPYFTNIKYSEINTYVVEEFLSKKLSEGFSSKYVLDMASVIKSIINWASRIYGYENKITDLKVPKITKGKQKLMNASEQKQLQKYLIADGSRTSMGILLTMYTGIRIGELCALTYEDIDFDEKILHIRKSVQRISIFGNSHKTAIKISTPKTENSIRDIPLPKFIVKLLRKNKASDETFLLSGNNKPVEPRCLSYRYKSILKKANVPSIKFHSLRHTFATNCLQCNFDIKTLSEILGHSNISTTMNIYIHSSLERKRICMNMLTI